MSEKNLEISTPQEKPKYKAKVGCSHGGGKDFKKVRAGEMIPASWPKEVIKHLLDRGVIEEA